MPLSGVMFAGGVHGDICCAVCGLCLFLPARQTM
jgi:hypothetical protein